ncbi:hypothetical protein VB780_05785 [Leptolyngbya sp. CCNP1308]|uniref:hypothetical protein n=1 Tax=Leptolyngbya sp. CCNP1308 TaxID=3110255 RepID=UPI002B1EBCEB|nr:hypothetical protein [Leptolyngbya sp. CCNP1308]MEA5448071.1 hypothetical protein [Leptolyngbya sp. CCNP1308]
MVALVMLLASLLPTSGMTISWADFAKDKQFCTQSLVGKLLFNREDAIALVYGAVMRNLSIALAIAITAFGGEQGSEIALIIAMAYIIQVQAAAWYVKLTDRIFGPAEQALPQAS